MEVGCKQLIPGIKSSMENHVVVWNKIAMIGQTGSSPPESLVQTEITTLMFTTQSGAPMIVYLKISSAETAPPGWRPIISRTGLMTLIIVRSPVPRPASIVRLAQVTCTSSAPGPTPASTQTWSVTATPSVRTTRTRTMVCVGRNTSRRRSLNHLQPLSADQ